jgi:1,2-diacylglycerol 3-alpha-glucosyltransferase
MPYDEVPAALAACDLFTSASVSEVHPLTFLEAMASGLAAVGTRSPGVADTLRDDQVCTNGGTQDNAQGTAPNGWLCEATPTALSACMVKALSDEEERKRRAEQAVRDSSAYSIEMTTRCTVDLYRLALTARMPSL